MSPRKISLGKIGDRRKNKKAESEDREKSGRAAGALRVPKEVGTAREMADPRQARSPVKESKKRDAPKRGTAPRQKRQEDTARRKPGKGVVESLDTSEGVRARRLVVPDDVRAEYGLMRDS